MGQPCVASQVAALMVGFAVWLMPPAHRARYRDEWLGELDILRRDGKPASMLLWAVKILAFAPSTGWSLRGYAPDRPPSPAPTGLDEGLALHMAFLKADLTARERFVLDEIVYRGRPLWAVADDLQLTTARVRQLRLRAIRKVGKLLYVQE